MSNIQLLRQIMDKYFGCFFWSWYVVWFFLCYYSLMLPHFQEELAEGRRRESCDTKDSKLCKCLKGKSTTWKLYSKKQQNGQYWNTWLSDAIFYSEVLIFVKRTEYFLLLSNDLLILPCWWPDIRYGSMF